MSISGCENSLYIELFVDISFSFVTKNIPPALLNEVQSILFVNRKLHSDFAFCNSQFCEKSLNGARVENHFFGDHKSLQVVAAENPHRLKPQVVVARVCSPSLYQDLFPRFTSNLLPKFVEGKPPRFLRPLSHWDFLARLPNSNVSAFPSCDCLNWSTQQTVGVFCASIVLLWSEQQSFPHTKGEQGRGGGERRKGCDCLARRHSCKPIAASPPNLFRVWFSLNFWVDKLSKRLLWKH